MILFPFPTTPTSNACLSTARHFHNLWHFTVPHHCLHRGSYKFVSFNLSKNLPLPAKTFYFLYIDTKISHIDFCVALISCKLSKQWQVGTWDNECSIRLIQINDIGKFRMRCRGWGLDSMSCQNQTDGQKLTLLPLYLDGLISRFLSFGSHLSFLALNGTP